MADQSSQAAKLGKKPGLFSVLTPYRGIISLLIVFSVFANLLNLVLPKVISRGIDAFVTGHWILKTTAIEFLIVAICMAIFGTLLSVVQTYASERVARDLRQQVSAKISRQTFAYIQEVTPAKILTNLTSDIDSIKLFVSQAIVSIISSLILILGSSIILFTINWRLALAVLTIIPVIGGTFSFVLSKVRVLFGRSREIIDWLNKVINESILGASLIRVLDSKRREADKFESANIDATNTGLKILKMFAALIPLITFVASIGTLIILAFGGHLIIQGAMTFGDFAAFNSYVALFIFPIFVIGFMSNVIAQATASYDRIGAILNADEVPETGTLTNALRGDVDVRDLVVTYGEKSVIKHVTFSIKGGTRTAIIGPTAAGKTQLLYALVGLFKPSTGTIQYDGQTLETYEKDAFYRQVGFVFQDSAIFNLSLRENIAFSDSVKDEDLKKAIDTAELQGYIESLPNGLNAVVSERGTSLSGGQKQRIMLARALALNPRILLLDDFTARVDRQTEERILSNVKENYPDLTLISITQKISSVEDYDQIILLMEGEVLATGTHAELMKSSPEYVQIYTSQQSTNHYELHAE